MIKEKLSELVKRNRTDQEIYYDLMSWRVREILLVASIYDAFILEEEEMLTEKVFVEYYHLNLSNAPHITSVPFGEEALDMLRRRHFDMVILTMRIDQMNPEELGRRIREINPTIPMLLLLNDNTEIALIEDKRDKLEHFDKIFVWNGDNKIFLAMIKYVEDKKNVDKDTRVGLVRVILLVEDSIRSYCSYMPTLYTEIMRQTQRVIADEHLDEMKKLLRMRTRPKVLMAESYESAVRIVDQYRDYLLCLITDVSFTRSGSKDPNAGLDLISYCRSRVSFLPVLIQSADPENREKAEVLHASFMSKRSEHISRDLRGFIYNKLGFGDFVFKDENVPLIDRARTMEEFRQKLAKVPESSLAYHSGHNHFSAWLMAHGEIRIAKSLQPVSTGDFPSMEDFRRHMSGIIESVQESNFRGKVIPYDRTYLPPDKHILRLTDGSLGGKGRGMAFLHMLSHITDLDEIISKVNIRIPKTAVIGTEEYDLFIEHNGLSDLFVSDEDYSRLKKRFLEGKLSGALRDKLKMLLEHFQFPLSVRSSGMFEDSLSQPFSGIYDTFMLPNNHRDLKVRLRQLEQAVKLVFASIFSKPARAYFESINYKPGEEKMAVLIQEIVGRRHGRYYYPDLAGNAQSYNFYPVAYLTPGDGIAVVAVGLGKHVIDGEKAHRFCPHFPRLEFLTPEEQLDLSQTSFYALDMEKNFSLSSGDESTLSRVPITRGEENPQFRYCVSTWDNDNHRLKPGLERPGPRVVNFASILKYGQFPLAGILEELLDMVRSAMGTPVEIEFAVDLGPGDRGNPTFYVLQIKPLLGNLEEYSLDLREVNRDEIFLLTRKSVGNGLVDHIQDIVFVDLEHFDRRQTVNMTAELAGLNARLKGEERPYILMGPGRWGSSDPWLGIPVDWSHISGAKIIVELDLPGTKVDPSLGSHFFHNITSMNIGYFDVTGAGSGERRDGGSGSGVPETGSSAETGGPETGRPGTGGSADEDAEFVDWAWLKEQPVVDRTGHFVHVRAAEPLVVRMDGRKSTSIICKPGSAAGSRNDG
jgi:CheY-like chemotaxis protein